MSRVSVVVCLLLLWSSSSHALGPHEVLILANGRSADSVMVAKVYAELRSVPDVNIVRLSLPAHVGGKSVTISPDDFASQILRPVERIARERGIEDHILAWVYSTDFPTVVKAGPEVSIQGYTFVRGRLPHAEHIRDGTYESPLFAGPSAPDSEGHSPQTFDVYRLWLTSEMPLPSMMLGYTGPRGNTVDEVVACLRRGFTSDFTAPLGTVCFVVSDDKRSKCRHWQFMNARDELREKGIDATISKSFPSNRRDVVGLQVGAARVNPKGNRYVPGCMAEHLTSLAGAFHVNGQTKLSAWVTAGATASAGTVVEPMAIWQKFPHARFFVHYVSGCTMIESFYQSIKCPMQILLVGDPLAQPWAVRGTVELRGLPDNVESEVLLEVGTSDPQGGHYGRTVFLVDGRIVGEGRRLRLDVRDLTRGSHTLRVVAYRTGLVRAQAFLEREFSVVAP